MNREYEEAKNNYEDGKFMVGASKILGLVSLVAISYLGLRTQLGPNFCESIRNFWENYLDATVLQKTDMAASYVGAVFTPFSAYLYTHGSLLKKKYKEKAELFKLDYRHNRELRNFFKK